MKIFLAISAALLAAASAVPLDRGLIPNGGRPGCRTHEELVARLWPNTDDPQLYWECQVAYQDAVQHTCPDGFLFSKNMDVCVPAAQWVWSPPQAPPTIAECDCPTTTPCPPCYEESTTTTEDPSKTTTTECPCPTTTPCPPCTEKVLDTTTTTDPSKTTTTECPCPTTTPCPPCIDETTTTTEDPSKTTTTECPCPTTTPCPPCTEKVLDTTTTTDPSKTTTTECPCPTTTPCPPCTEKVLDTTTTTDPSKTTTTECPCPTTTPCPPCIDESTTTTEDPSRTTTTTTECPCPTTTPCPPCPGFICTSDRYGIRWAVNELTSAFWECEVRDQLPVLRHCPAGQVFNFPIQMCG